MRDKRILLIGGNYSAEDVALQCQKFGSKEIHLAYNRGPLGYGPVQEHPSVSHFEGPRTAHFQDGTKAEIDMVKHVYTLSSEIKLKTHFDKLRFSLTNWIEKT